MDRDRWMDGGMEGESGASSSSFIKPIDLYLIAAAGRVLLLTQPLLLMLLATAATFVALLLFLDSVAAAAARLRISHRRSTIFFLYKN